MKHPYEDILHLPHHTSPTRPRMSAIDRAAQFSPFAALTGFEAAIAETGRLTDRPIELTDSARETLDEKLHLLMRQPELEGAFTYFQPDLRKEGGEYVTVTGCLKRLDPLYNRLLLQDGTVIELEDVIEIQVRP